MNRGKQSKESEFQFAFELVNRKILTKTVTEACKLAKLDRVTYYKWLKLYKNQERKLTIFDRIKKWFE